MGLYSAAMLAEVSSGGEVYFAYEQDLPDGSTLRYAQESLMSSAGHYKPLTMEFGPIPKRTSVWDPNIETFGVSISIADHGRTLSKLLGGELDGLLEGQASRIKLVSPNVDSADWFTHFSGKFKIWAAEGPLPTITIQLGLSDKPMQSAAKLGRITTDIFTTAAFDILDTPIPAVYGINVRAMGGSVIGYRISPTEWLVSAGLMEEITTVYEDEESSTNTWNEQQSIREGRSFTEIAFDTDPGDVDISCDCKGLTANGDGTGSAIVNPVTQLEHKLVNWFFNAYETGDYYTAAAGDLNATYFGNVETWMGNYGWTSKYVLTEATTGYQLLNEWASAWRAAPIFWTSAGALGMAVDEWNTYPASQDVLYQRQLLSELTTENLDDGLCDEVVVRHGYHDADGSTTTESKAKDLSRSFGVTKEIDNAWSED